MAHKKRKRFKFGISLEKGTIRHQIALVALRSKGDDPTSPTSDYELFVGNVKEKSLFDDMLANPKNRRRINREEQRRLEV